MAARSAQASIGLGNETADGGLLNWPETNHQGLDFSTNATTMNRRELKMMNLAVSATLAALALGSGVAFAAPARADTAGYLAWLQDQGATGSMPNGDSFLSMGTADCAALRAGKSERFLIINLAKEIDSASAEAVVVGAHRYLCPDA